MNWNVTRRIGPIALEPLPTIDFSHVMEKRRSCREMTRAPLRQIVRLLTFATRARYELTGDPFVRTRRPSPSAGALHPIDIIIIHGTEYIHLLNLDAVSGCLQILDSHAVRGVRELRTCAQEILPGAAEGTLLLFIADFRRTAEAYEHCDSLVWRDAGALMQTISLCAAALDLAFCALGILGDELAHSISSGCCHGVGVGIVGSAVHG